MLQDNDVRLTRRSRFLRLVARYLRRLSVKNTLRF